MANHKQAKKRIRQTDKRQARNRSRLNRVRSFVRKFEESLATNDKAAVEAAFTQAMAELHRAAGKGLFHKNTVARKISRMNKRVAAISA